MNSSKFLSTKVLSTTVQICWNVFYQSPVLTKSCLLQNNILSNSCLPKSGLLKNGILPNSVLPKSVPPWRRTKKRSQAKPREDCYSKQGRAVDDATTIIRRRKRDAMINALFQNNISNNVFPTTRKITSF
jgi:hypothetical protein